VPANKLLAREGSTPAEVVVVRQGSIRVSGENLPGGGGGMGSRQQQCCSSSSSFSNS
jgi:hypothetical protein